MRESREVEKSESQEVGKSRNQKVGSLRGVLFSAGRQTSARPVILLTLQVPEPLLSRCVRPDENSAKLARFGKQLLCVRWGEVERATQDVQPVLRLVRFLRNDAHARRELSVRSRSTGRAIVRADRRSGIDELAKN